MWTAVYMAAVDNMFALDIVAHLCTRHHMHSSGATAVCTQSAAPCLLHHA